MRAIRTVFLLLPTLAAAAPAEAPAKRTAKEALRPFNDLIGSWRGTGEPYGTRAERQKGFWEEKIAWQWQFKGADAWLLADIDKGKHFSRAELRYLPARDRYELKLTTPKKETLAFEGALKDKQLTLERRDAGKGEAQRLVLSLLHSNRYLLRYDVRAAGQRAFVPRFRVGATKEGVAFAGADAGPECIVSGGKGTIPVSHKGKTYYVCCTGCRDEFKAEPDKYVAEFEAKKKTK
jgi:YHS domain-containing protein